VSRQPGRAVEIAHNAGASRFEALLDDQLGVCAYRLHGDIAVFVHTEVPPALQGRGVAAALVRAALQWARDSGLRVRPACSYVAVYMRRHPETLDLVEH
jgi:hypothetical protein